MRPACLHGVLPRGRGTASSASSAPVVTAAARQQAGQVSYGAKIVLLVQGSGTGGSEWEMLDAAPSHSPQHRVASTKDAACFFQGQGHGTCTRAAFRCGRERALAAYSHHGMAWLHAWMDGWMEVIIPCCLHRLTHLGGQRDGMQDDGRARPRRHAQACKDTAQGPPHTLRQACAVPQQWERQVIHRFRGNLNAVHSVGMSA